VPTLVPTLDLFYNCTNAAVIRIKNLVEAIIIVVVLLKKAIASRVTDHCTGYFLLTKHCQCFVIRIYPMERSVALLAIVSLGNTTTIRIVSTKFLVLITEALTHW
jgi:hypothetical protein